MWFVKKDLPEPDGPNINLLRLSIIPFSMGKSEISRCRGLPVNRSTILIPKGESEDL